MPGVFLYSSNRLESLARELARRISHRPDPLFPETILIQSRGMERWLSMAIARASGIVANCRFPFPGAFVEELFELLGPRRNVSALFEPPVMTLRIMHDLPRLVDTEAVFEPIRRYLNDDPQGVKCYQLAAQLADLLDQYQVFRPETILAWDKGETPGQAAEEAWQSRLWQNLTQGRQSDHRVALWRDLVRRLESGQLEGIDLPPRISLFGIAYLPPYYMRVLTALGRHMAVHFYHLNPCCEYWADIQSPREQERTQRRYPLSAASPGEDQLHLDAGNRLLAALGRLGREFQFLAEEFDFQVTALFEEFAPQSLLEAVQHDLLHLVERGAPHRPAAALLSPPGMDRSIQIHACHSPMREIEVLHDQLLYLLEENPDLEPRDILVLSPDLPTYAPYIQAVFGAQTDSDLDLPFSIADQGFGATSLWAEALLTLLRLKDARFRRSEVLRLLEFPALQARFDLPVAYLDDILQWLDQTNIAWGMDGASKRLWDLPETDQNSWQAGLDRLVLGYAMQPEDRRLWREILPAPISPGGDIRVLGRLADLVGKLWRWFLDVRAPRRLSEWQRLLRSTLEDFFLPEEESLTELATVQKVLAEMGQNAAAAGCETPVTAEVVLAYLKRALNRPRPAGGFIAGGITFGALVPMRSIPARVICLVGVNHDRFPREDRPLSFDLMAARPRTGDRSKRSDDKYLFLEALVSARDCLYLSYVGHDSQDNAPLPPSVLVSLLLDYLVEGFGAKASELVIHHRLQAFAPDYFSDRSSALISYSVANCRAARSLNASRRRGQTPGPLLDQALALWPPGMQICDAGQLVEALFHPCRFLLQKRLDLHWRDDAAHNDDHESFALDYLARFRLGQNLVDGLIAGEDAGDIFAAQQAAGELPHGAAGAVEFNRVHHEAAEMVAQVQSIGATAGFHLHTVELDLAGYRISAELALNATGEQVVYRFAKFGGRDLIAAWARHLMWCALAEGDAADAITWLVNRDAIHRFAWASGARDLFHSLLDLYFEAGHVPLPIFPRASFAYAWQRFARGRTDSQALRAAHSAWRGNSYQRGEADDPYIHACFRGVNPFERGFAATTARLFAPLWECVTPVTAAALDRGKRGAPWACAAKESS